MVLLWDYNKKSISHTEKGRILILERMINNGVYIKDKKKLPSGEIKKYWERLNIEPGRKKYLRLLLWGK